MKSLPSHESLLACSVKTELFLASTGELGLSLVLNLDHIESDGLGEGSALSNSHDVTFLYSGEGWGAVSGQVLVSLLKTVVLLDVMEVVAANDDSSLHLS